MGVIDNCSILGEGGEKNSAKHYILTTIESALDLDIILFNSRLTSLRYKKYPPVPCHAAFLF